MAERFVDFGSNLNGKMYLAKLGSTGSGKRIEATITDWEKSGGEREREKLNLLSSNFAMVTKPSSLVELSMTIVSDKNLIDFYEMMHGTKTTTSGVDTVVGESEEPSPYRLIYETELLNATTNKTEVRRWTFLNVYPVGEELSIPSEDAIEISFTLSCAMPNFIFEQTLDKTTSPLPSIGDYNVTEPEEPEPE